MRDTIWSIDNAEERRLGKHSRLSLDGAEDRLNGPKLRRRVEPTVEDQLRVPAIAGDNVSPGTWQTVRGFHSEEVALGRLA